MNHLWLEVGVCGPCTRGRLVSLDRSSARAQNDAASLFKAKCAACHGADGSGKHGRGKIDEDSRFPFRRTCRSKPTLS